MKEKASSCQIAISTVCGVRKFTKLVQWKLFESEHHTRKKSLGGSDPFACQGDLFPIDRWGSITCRTRRLKCDESKPAYLRSQKFRVVCADYWPMGNSNLQSSLILSKICSKRQSTARVAEQSRLSEPLRGNDVSTWSKRKILLYQSHTRCSVISNTAKKRFADRQYLGIAAMLLDVRHVGHISHSAWNCISVDLDSFFKSLWAPAWAHSITVLN